MDMPPIPDHQQRRAAFRRKKRRAEITLSLEMLVRKWRAYSRPSGVIATILDTSRRLLTGRNTGVSPRRARPRPEAVAGLIHEQEDPALPARLLSATHSRLGQTAITSSSRSLARVAGRCTLKPCALSGRSR